MRLYISLPVKILVRLFTFRNRRFALKLPVVFGSANVLVEFYVITQIIQSAGGCEMTRINFGISFTSTMQLDFDILLRTV